jgi:hypothetical protein
MSTEPFYVDRPTCARVGFQRFTHEVSMRQAHFRKTAAGILACGVLLCALGEVASAQGGNAAPMKLKVGDTAPEFKLEYFDGSGLKPVSLSQYHGKKNVLLAFYIFAFTGG